MLIGSTKAYVQRKPSPGLISTLVALHPVNLNAITAFERIACGADIEGHVEGFSSGFIGNEISELFDKVIPDTVICLLY